MGGWPLWIVVGMIWCRNSLAVWALWLFDSRVLWRLGSAEWQRLGKTLSCSKLIVIKYHTYHTYIQQQELINMDCEEVVNS